MELPRSMSMIQEDHSELVFQPTIIPPSSTIQQNVTVDESKGRSLNFTLENNNLSNSSSFDKYGDLSDVDMDDNDDEDVIENDQANFAKILTSKHVENNGNVTLGKKKLKTNNAFLITKYCFILKKNKNNFIQ